MKPWIHAKNSAKTFGGKPEDYIDIHNFIDSSKAHHADIRHRALFHSSLGIYICEQIFGHLITMSDNTIKKMPYILNSDNRKIQVRDIAENHILDDLGKIPSVSDYLNNMSIQKWMSGSLRKKIIPLKREED